MRGMMTQQYVGDAENKRYGNAGQGHIQGSAAHADQVLGRRFQPNCEEKKDGADASNSVDRICRHHQTRTVRSKNHTSKNFAQHCGKVHPLKGFTKEFGPHEDEKQLKEKWISSMHGTLILFPGPGGTLNLYDARLRAKSRVDAGF